MKINTPCHFSLSDLIATRNVVTINSGRFSSSSITPNPLHLTGTKKIQICVGPRRQAPIICRAGGFVCLQRMGDVCQVVIPEA